MTLPTDSWTDEVRRQAVVSLHVATAQQTASTRTLGYFIRCAMAHGVTLAEVCEITKTSEATALSMADPAVAA